MADAAIEVRSPGTPRPKRKAMTSEEKKQKQLNMVASLAATDAADASQPAERIGLWFYESSTEIRPGIENGLPFFHNSRFPDE